MIRLRATAALTALLLPLGACAPVEDGWVDGPMSIDPAGPPLPLPRVDDRIGLGYVVTEMRYSDEESAERRSQHSVGGAEAAAVLFTGAWGDALLSGDGARLRGLSAESCSVCHRIADSVDASSPDPDLMRLTRAWPFEYLAPTKKDENPVIVMGVEHSAFKPPADSETMEVAIQWRRLLRVSITWSQGIWLVDDITALPWDGTMPRRR